jgi:hypothetical protein
VEQLRTELGRIGEELKKLHQKRVVKRSLLIQLEREISTIMWHKLETVEAAIRGEGGGGVMLIHAAMPYDAGSEQEEILRVFVSELEADQRDVDARMR